MPVANLRTLGVFCRPTVKVKRDFVCGLAEAIYRLQGWQIAPLAGDDHHQPLLDHPPLSAIVAWPDHADEIPLLLGCQQSRLFIGPMEHPAMADSDRLVFDNHGIGRLVAEVLLAQGFLHFAGFFERYNPQGGYSIERWAGFCKRLSEAGVAPTGYFEAHDLNPKLPPNSKPRKRLEAWLASLPKPCGVLCDRDAAGFHLLAACRHFGIRVPDELAVIAVGNDEMLCAIAWPPMSSIELFGKEAGNAAAHLVEWRIKNPRAPARFERLQHFQMVPRRSSEASAVSEPRLAAALAYIRDTEPATLTVDRLATAAGVSRRLLEQLFRQNLDTSPHAEIQRARLERAKDLLLNTSLGISEIADRCGFSEPQRLSEAFRRATGTSPSTWRRSPTQPIT